MVSYFINLNYKMQAQKHGKLSLNLAFASRNDRKKLVIDHLYRIFPDALKCNACSDGEK